MIIPDLNLLLYAYNRDDPFHRRASAWWAALLDGDRPVGLAWITILGFLRIGCNRRVFPHALDVGFASAQIRTWLNRPQVTVVAPGRRHAELLFGFLERLGVAGDLATDAHLAALAIEYQAELHSADTDFARFPGLRWRNPLAGR